MNLKISHRSARSKVQESQIRFSLEHATVQILRDR